MIGKIRIALGMDAPRSVRVPIRPWKWVVAVLLVTAFALGAQCSHLAGGDITWTCNGDNEYDITLDLYRDCSGVLMGTEYPIVAYVPGSSLAASVSVYLQSVVDVSQLCPAQMPQSSCNGGTLPGMERHRFIGTLWWPNPDPFIIEYVTTYRNPYVINITLPGSRRFVVRSYVNPPCHPSPVFAAAPVPYVCAGQTAHHSFQAVGPYQIIHRADTSLCYPWTFSAPHECIYQVPYGPSTPVPGWSVDPASGIVTASPTILGGYVVAVTADFYLAGQWRGSITRDTQFVVLGCDNAPPNNDAPILSSTAPVVDGYTMNPCGPAEVCWTIEPTDPDGPASIVSVSPGTWNENTICASVTDTTVVVVTITDHACPIPSTTSVAYQVDVGCIVLELPWPPPAPAIDTTRNDAEGWGRQWDTLGRLTREAKQLDP